MKFIASLAAFFVLGLLIIYLAIPFEQSWTSDDRTVTDPYADFLRIVGMPLPKSATQIEASDDHGGFHGDGTFRLTARISLKETSKLISRPAPWDAEWVGYSELNERAQGHVSRKENARYAATERCCESLEWHNGDILVVDPSDGTLNLISWDY